MSEFISLLPILYRKLETVEKFLLTITERMRAMAREARIDM